MFAGLLSVGVRLGPVVARNRESQWSTRGSEVFLSGLALMIMTRERARNLASGLRRA